MALVREALGWPHAPFDIPSEIYAQWDARAKGAAAQAGWETLFAEYRSAYPREAAELLRRSLKALPDDWRQNSQDYIRGLQDEPAALATRQASQQTLNHFIQWLPERLGGPFALEFDPPR